MLSLCSLNELLEYAEDYECDVPKFWDYLAELLAPSVAHKGFPLVILKQAHEGPLESGKIGKLVAKTLNKCSTLKVIGLNGRGSENGHCGLGPVSMYISLVT